MNAASAMSIWFLASLVLVTHVQVPSVEAFSTVYRHSSSGRKLFGGYRIVPKSCVGAGGTKGSAAAKRGVCMFNYECTQRGGEMIGSCIDGFLFGACCSLSGSDDLQSDIGYIDLQTVTARPPFAPAKTTYSYAAAPAFPKTTTTTTTQKAPPAVTTQTAVGSLNGDFLNNVFAASEDPDEILGSFLSGESAVHYGSPEKPLLGQYLNNENQGQFVDNQGFLPVHKYPIAETLLLNPDGSVVVEEADPELLFTRPTRPASGSGGGHQGVAVKKPAPPGGGSGYGQRPPTTSPTVTEMRKTTKVTAGQGHPVTQPPGGYPATSAGNLVLVNTLTHGNRTAKPTPSTSKASTKFSYATTKIPFVEMDDRYPGFHYESYSGISKPPIVITSPVGFDGSGQAISHIIGLLNNTTDRKPVEQVTATSGAGDAGLSTWVSITGGSAVLGTKNKYATTKVPSTTTEYVHGPAFTVQENESKPVPTVIVISPPSTDASPGTFYPKPTKKPAGAAGAHGTRKPPPKYPEAVPVLATGEEHLVNFPPVRNPDLNASGLNQVEKPTIVHSGGYPLPDGLISSIDVLPDAADLNTIDPDEDYADFTTPALEDEKVNVKLHNFVEKIVNSLAGNFQDLEGVLFRNENKTKLPNQNGIELSNVQVGQIETEATTTRKPPKRPTDSEEATAARPTKRPKPPAASVFTTVSPIVTSKRPLVQIGSTKLTTTRRPATAAATATTRRPTSAVSPTKRPAQTTATTRRPTRRPTTTTKRTRTTTTELPAEETQPPTTAEAPEAVEHSTPDFRRECGVRPMVKKGGRIVGGKGSQFGHYPWQVLVRESTWLGLFTKNKCGGVLITHRYVITAAHCQPGFLASLVAVFGEFDISGELESRRSVTKNVRRVIVHRQYDPATFENDLALLELDSPIAYDEHIVPICMPREGEDYVGRMATVTGWGRLKYGGGVPSVLQEVRVPLIDNSVCQEMFQTAGHQKRIISSFLCAGYANGQKDSCEGDSGGPLMVEREDGRWVLLGTVSHGIKCAAPYLPGVYMRTTYYKPWLKSITGVAT